MSDKYTEWVRTAQVVEARYATGDGCHARGVVYAYTDRPTVHLRKADGSKTNWIADLCVPVEPLPGEFDNGWAASDVARLRRGRSAISNLGAEAAS